MQKVFDELKERGYVKQLTDDTEIEKMLNSEKISVYVGFDPTKETMHVGHLIPIMILSHLQKAGHRPICVVGGATAQIGDPSGKDSMREMLTLDNINSNVDALKSQLSHFIDFSEDKAVLVNNFDWFGDKNYIKFLREVGSHFTVNRMLSAECFKIRMEKGLTFLEFNYMILQAYDFFHLSREYGCRLQVGGDDQWSNILAGADLIRRVDQKIAYGLTTPLLTKSDGKKMGKTESGAVWLDPTLTSPYEYFQFWRNTLDNDVIKFMKLYTFIPMDKVREYEKMEGAELNKAKEALAYEATLILHGKEEAEKAISASQNIFAGGGASTEGAPEFDIERSRLLEMSIIDLSVETSIFGSKGEAKRMIKQGGLSLNDSKVTNMNQILSEDDIIDGKISLRKGKKKFFFVNAT